MSENALSFALDVQKLQGTGKLNPVTFKELTDRYNPNRQGKTLFFQDGSACTWVEEEQSWRLEDDPAALRNPPPTLAAFVNREQALKDAKDGKHVIIFYDKEEDDLALMFYDNNYDGDQAFLVMEYELATEDDPIDLTFDDKDWTSTAVGSWAEADNEEGLNDLFCMYGR